MNDDLLILVDHNDQPVGYLDKESCHNGDGVLHRAFSVFLFDEQGRLLLQQRAAGKRLWGGFWSNTCCSHPRQGEETLAAAHRRLQEELGLDADQLEYIFKFAYQANFGAAGSEHELCYVYLGRLQGEPVVNADEIAAIRYISAEELSADLERSPETYTPWFRQEWARLTGEFAPRLAPWIHPNR